MPVNVVTLPSFDAVRFARRTPMLRCLATLLLFSSILASCPAVRADEAEDKAVALVKKLGGKVTRDDQQPGHPVVTVCLGSA
jgi:hypothetical protein